MINLDRIARNVASSCVSPSKIRTAGRVEFIRDQGPIRRDIRVKDFEWSSDSLRNLAKILWSAQRAHSYAITALRVFSKMPSSQFSPDGLLGGRGYIQQVKDMRSSLSQAVEVLSSFTDTVHDEINAEHWSSTEDAKTEALVDDAAQVKANPEDFISEEMQGVDDSGEVDESEFTENPSPDDLNPQVEEPESDESEPESEFEPDDGGFTQFSSQTKPKKPKSELPSDSSDQEYALTAPEMVMRTTIPESGNYAGAIRNIIRSMRVIQASARNAGGNSSLPQSTLPGPRVDSVGPGTTEDGFFNDPSARPSDDLALEGLSSGVQTSKPLYEEWCADGISGYDNPTDGDETVLKLSMDKISKLLSSATYSWLPGTTNEKQLPYYDRSLTAEDVKWMRENNQPDPPQGTHQSKSNRDDTSYLWESQS